MGWIVHDRGRGDYRILHEAALRDYLAGLPDLVALLGAEPVSWSITEVGDGNLNLVFIVKGDRGGVAVEAGAALCPPRRRELAAAAVAGSLRISRLVKAG
jgi:hypothetical protein